MKTVPDNILKEKIVDYFREVEATGEELIVTHEGEMVMKIISYRRELSDNDTNHTDSTPSF